MKVQIIQVPYDSAHRSLRMGAGPEHFIRRGIANVLSSHDYEMEVDSVEAVSLFPTEIKTAFELCRLLAVRVRAVYSEGSFPLVLSGNCNSSLGTIAGIGSKDLGMIWFDAHGDFNNPETRESTFFDGMGMSIATGHSWRKLAATIPGFRAMDDESVLHVGGRDFDAEERVLLEQSGIRLVTAESIRQSGIEEALSHALDSLRTRVRDIYLHVDLDVLDPEETPANEYAGRVPNGLKVEQVEEAIRMIGARFYVRAAGIASYDPAYDTDDKTFHAGVKIMKSILDEAKS